MKSAAVAVCGLLASGAIAKPHGHGHAHAHQRAHRKRDDVGLSTVWETVTATVTEHIDSYQTLWFYPDGSVSTHVSPPTTSLEQPAQFFQHPLSSSTSSSDAPAGSVAVQQQQQPAPVVMPTSAVIPSYAPAAIQPPPPPPSDTPAAAPPATTAVGGGAGSAGYGTGGGGSNSGGSGGGDCFSGDITYYDVGPGACGWDDSGNGGGNSTVPAIVAISPAIMGDGPTLASNPFCGRMMTITANGVTVLGQARDKCPSCSQGSIDVNPGLFIQLFGSTTSGRNPVSWCFN